MITLILFLETLTEDIKMLLVFFVYILLIGVEKMIKTEEKVKEDKDRIKKRRKSIEKNRNISRQNIMTI